MVNFKMKMFCASENRVRKRQEGGNALKITKQFFKEFMQQFQNAYAF